MTQINADFTQIDTDSALTEQVIGAAFRVHKELGSGFLEAVYVRALLIEMRSIGLEVDAEVPLAVFYKGTNVGDYRVDLLVSRELIIEVKALETLQPIHEQQLLHYLRATRKRLGLLINFGKSVNVKRKIASKNLRQSA